MSSNINLLDTDEIPTWIMAWSQLMTQQFDPQHADTLRAQQTIQQLCLSL